MLLPYEISEEKLHNEIFRKIWNVINNPASFSVFGDAINEYDVLQRSISTYSNTRTSGAGKSCPPEKVRQRSRGGKQEDLPAPRHRGDPNAFKQAPGGKIIFIFHVAVIRMVYDTIIMSWI